MESLEPAEIELPSATPEADLPFTIVSSSLACVNCNAEVTSRFCPDCGQPNPPKKLGLRNMWYDFQSRIYGFDGMFPRTIKDLTVRPGSAARDYIRGNRVKYYGPVGYFFLMITVYLLIASLLGVDLKEFLKLSGSMVQQPPPGTGQEKLNNQILNLVSDNLKIFSFLIIPLQAFTATLFYRKSGYNFIEHSVMPLFVTGHAFWFSIISVIFFKYSGPNVMLLLLGIMAIPLYLWASVDFYSYQPRWKVFFKSIFVYIVSYLLYVTIFVAITLIFIFTKPEYLEMIRPSNNR